MPPTRTKTRKPGLPELSIPAARLAEILDTMSLLRSGGADPQTAANQRFAQAIDEMLGLGADFDLHVGLLTFFQLLLEYGIEEGRTREGAAQFVDRLGASVARQLNLVLEPVNVEPLKAAWRGESSE